MYQCLVTQSRLDYKDDQQIILILKEDIILIHFDLMQILMDMS